VVMATALLALAVLQGTLTRNTADSRGRTLIAQLGDSLIDKARSSGYTNLANGSTTISPAAPAACPDPTTTLSSPSGTLTALTPANLAYCTQQAAGVGGLSLTQVVT